MKKTFITLTLLSCFAFQMQAQRFGNVDPMFFSNGRYAFTQPSDMDIMLTFIDHRFFPDENTFTLLVGGNYSKNFRHEGAIMARISPDRLFSRMGMPSADLHRLYEGVVTHDNKLLVAGYKQLDAGNPEARIGRFQEPDVIDRNFGTNGTVLVDNVNGRDDVGGFVLDEGDPTQPFIYLNGATDNGSGTTNPVWWKFNNDGTPVTAFGTSGRVMHSDAYGWSGFWHAEPFGTSLVGIGAADELGYLALFNPATSQWKHHYNPSVPVANLFYEATGAIAWEKTLLLTGIRWNMTTSKGTAWVQFFADATADRLTPDHTIGETFQTSLATLETENSCTITGIFKPAVWTVPATMQQKNNQPEGGYILAGTIEYATGPEQTFVAAFTRDGEIYREFGTGGFTVIRIDPGSWPVDMVYSEDGYIYVAMNGGDRFGYLYRLTGYRDLSGTGFNEQSHYQLSLYPNPVSDQLWMTVQLPLDETAEVTIADVLGKVVFMDKHLLHTGQNRLEINVSQLPAGTYFVRLTAGKRVMNERFIRR